MVAAFSIANWDMELNVRATPKSLSFISIYVLKGGWKITEGEGGEEV